MKRCKSKVANCIYAINRPKHFVPKNYMKTLYYTLIYPHLTYGITLWGSTYNTHKKKLVIMQKRTIRIIENVKYNEHTNPLFIKAGILKLDDIYIVEVLKVVFKYLQGSLPLPLTKLFTLNTEIYERETRQRGDLHILKCRTTLAAQHIAHKGPRIWNSLPTGIKNLRSSSLKTFVKKVVGNLLERYCLH